MTIPPTFPQLAGLGWSVHKRPTFSTRIASHVSGREVRVPLYATTLYEFELTYDALASTPGFVGVGATSLQTLLGFYLGRQGAFGTFIYVDPTDNAAHAQPIAIGDGTNTSFTFVRTLGGCTEAVSYVTQVNAVTLNGVVQGGWSLTTPNTLTFTTPPAADTIIAVDFAYAFLCRFLDDQEDFENVMSGLWQMSSLKFRSVRA